MFVAHIRETDKEIQLLKFHLLETKKLAETFGSKLNVSHVAGLCGLLHDIGKYNPLFQQYINEVIFHPEDTKFKRGDIDHSTAGGKLMYEYFHQEVNSPHEMILAEIVGNAIISHHSDLKDFLSVDRGKSPFLDRVAKK